MAYIGIYIGYSLHKLKKVAILILPLWQVARVNDEKSIQMGLWAVCRAAPIAKLNQRYDKRIRYLGAKPLFECQMATKCIESFNLVLRVILSSFAPNSPLIL